MKPSTIVYCAVTNSVLYARDALFGVDGKAYRAECAPKDATVGDFTDDDEPAGEPTELITVAVDVTTADEAGDIDVSADNEAATDDPDDDEPEGEDYPSARHNGRHNRHGGR